MAEIGVGDGGGAARYLREFPALTAWLIDPWHAHPDYLESVKRVQPANGFDQAWFDRVHAGVVGRVAFAGGRARILRMTSRDAAPLVPDGECSLVFIDGMHTKESVLADCRLYWPKIRPGGLFCGHDYGNRRHPGVAVAVDCWAAEMGFIVGHAPSVRGLWYVCKAGPIR